MPEKRKIQLIVNADDFNLTPGVSEGILEAHDRGMVTSTTALVNVPFRSEAIREARKRKRLGVGLHLNVTLGKPLLPPEEVPSLTDGKGAFGKRKDFSGVSRVELLLEFERQIERFSEIFGQAPSHLDTHHQIHDDPAVFEVMRFLAFRHRLPVRLSRCFGKAEKERFGAQKIPFADFLVPDLDPARAWTERPLERALGKMTGGIYELMCHPARCDARLKRISSFNLPRESELRALCSREVLKRIEKRNIQLMSYKSLKG
ncbi:MAG TPA: ChbG/HpnK family deacetylase [Candidatus Omnitrophota bacterium]|nr:ChbG/HpnK family deacetylase [Candidatus Omnitrophota bacterium]